MPQSTASAQEVLDIALAIGSRMQQYGGEIHRIEDTVSRICRAYCAEMVEVFAIPSLILVTIRMPDGSSATQSRRITTISNNLLGIEQLNSLSREICRTPCPCGEVLRRVEKIHALNPYPLWLQLVGAAMAAGAFAVFFGGNLRDGIAAALTGVLLTLFTDHLPARISRMAHTSISSFFGGVLAQLTVFLSIGQHTDKVMIGVIMLLIPGLALGNAVRDLLDGDLVSGALQLLQSLLLAVMIAFGFAAAILLLGGVLA